MFRQTYRVLWHQLQHSFFFPTGSPTSDAYKPATIFESANPEPSKSEIAVKKIFAAALKMKLLMALSAGALPNESIYTCRAQAKMKTSFQVEIIEPENS